MTAIDRRLFHNCSSLNFVLPQRITALGESCFEGTAVEAMNLMNVKVGGAGAFRRSRLERVTLGPAIASLPAEVFLGSRLVCIDASLFTRFGESCFESTPLAQVTLRK